MTRTTFNTLNLPMCCPLIFIYINFIVWKFIRLTNCTVILQVLLWYSIDEGAYGGVAFADKNASALQEMFKISKWI
jgi:hypothetical protein